MAEMTSCFRYLGPLRKVRDSKVYVARSRLMDLMFPNGELTTDWYVVYGFGQSGKTTFLYQISDKLSGMGRIRHMFLGFQQGIKDEKDLLRFLRVKVEEVTGEAYKPFEHILDVKPFIIKFACDAADAGERAAILMDDIRQIEDRSVLSRFLQQFRAAFHKLVLDLEHVPLTVVAATSMDLQGLLTEQVEESPFTNICRDEYLENFSSDETEWLVRSGFAASGLRIEESLPTEIYRMTSGHPQLTQRLCFLIASRGTAAQEGRKISSEAVHAAADLMLTGTTFSQVEEVYKAEQYRPILSAVYLGEPVPFSRANKGIFGLELKGMIRNNNGRCVFNNQMVEAFMETKIGVNRRPARESVRSNILIAGDSGMGKTTHLRKQVEDHIDGVTFVVFSREAFNCDVPPERIHRMTEAEIALYVRSADFSFSEKVGPVQEGKINVCSPPEVSELRTGLLLSLSLDQVRATLDQVLGDIPRYVFVLDGLPGQSELAILISQLYDLTRRYPNLRFWWAVESIRDVPRDIGFRDMRFFKTVDEEERSLMAQRKPGMSLESLAQLPIGVWL